MTQSFDEWYFDAKKHNADGFTNREFYEAGAQSRQAEVDELKSKLEVAEKNLNNSFRTIKFEQQYQDELQKRTDRSLDLLKGKSIGEVYKAIRILKGEQNDN